jgi:hypothetical protein
MKTLRNLIENIVNKTFKKQEITLLGRWKIEHCKNKTDKKIDLANQDNCGPCGHYKITTTKV